MIKCFGRRPRKPQRNQNNVDEVFWGGRKKVEIMIPKLIDEYNHWMGGVDLCDQHIVTTTQILDLDKTGFLYSCKSFQLFALIPTSFKRHTSKKASSHNDFTMEMIHYHSKFLKY